MKKFLKVTLLLLIGLLLISCGNGKKNDENVKNSNGKKKMKVAVVFAGFLGDKSFNDSAYEGLKKAQEEFGIEFKVLESKVPSDWETNYLLKMKVLS